MTHDRNVTLPRCRTFRATVAAAVLLMLVPSGVWAQSLEVVVRHDSLRTRLDAMQESGLKTLYLHCSKEAMQRALGSGEAASCSIVYETLLRRWFGGDFIALLAWSRAQRDVVFDSGSPETLPASNVQPRQR